VGITIDADAEDLRSAPRFLIIRVGGRRWALPLIRVRRVVPSVMVYPVPGSRPHCLGLAQVDGQATPVIDPRALKDGQGIANRGPGRTLVVRVDPGDGDILAVAVDEVVAVVDAADSRSRQEQSGLALRCVTVGGDDIEVLDLGVDLLRSE